MTKRERILIDALENIKRKLESLALHNVVARDAIETINKHLASYNNQKEEEFQWNDDLVKRYAEIYRFSSSRTSIEQFKKNPEWGGSQKTFNDNYNIAINTKIDDTEERKRGV